VIACLFRAHDAISEFIHDAREFGWVLVLSLKSRCRR
jgi:hypothetical protein